MVSDNVKSFKKLAEDGVDKKTSAFSAGVKTQLQPTGSSGTEIFGGYFSEEYLNTLRGSEAALVWDKMRRSEAQVAMLMAAVMNPIKSACWEIEPYKQEPDYIRHAELIKSILFEGIDFETFKHEALTLVPFGFSAFEVVHNVVFNHPEYGTFNGLQVLGFRSQKTIQSWKLEKKTGRIISIEQLANGDVSENANIPGEFLIVFTNSKEGDNYEGISALRPMYGSYIRKQLYLKLTAIGVEKYAVGTPIGTVPANKGEGKDFEEFKKVLAAYTSHENAYITRPEGWEIEIQKNDFDASKVVELLKFENTEMVNALVANFLALGTNGSGGAFALSNDLSDFFSSGIQSYADIVTCGINRKLIPDLCKLNYGQLRGYPKLKVSGISDKAGKELAEVIGILIERQAVKPDMPLEEFLRRQYKLPKADEATARQVQQTQPNASPPTVQTYSLAEVENEFTKLIENGKGETKALMQASLRQMANNLKKKLTEQYTKAKTEGAKIEAPTKVEISADEKAAYELKLRDSLAKQAKLALDQANKETKK